MTWMPWVLAGVLLVLLLLERWERRDLQARYLRAVDAHAATVVQTAQLAAGGRVVPAATLQAPEAEPEDIAERRSAEDALRRGIQSLIAEGMSAEEAEAEARDALAAVGVVL